jgi:hypothetical protein
MMGYTTGPKAVRPTNHGLESPKTIGQNKPFVFIRWLFQIFCYSGTKLTNTVFNDTLLAR